MNKQISESKFIHIGNRREVFWDDYLIDSEKTTARLTIHKPIKQEEVYQFDKPWEEKLISYPNSIYFNGEWYMYYISGIACQPDEQRIKDFNKEALSLKIVCVMKGSDLYHLERPNVGLYEFDGKKDNNIILMQRCINDLEEEFDNFFVFVDENPACPPQEKIKAIAQTINRKKGFPGFRELWSYTSADGINFKLGWKLSGADEPFAGLFDSLNTVHYDTDAGVYRMYVRGLHLDYGIAASANVDGLITAEMEKTLARDGIRDIRYMESKDFKNWTIPKLLQYNDNEDYPLYTNIIQKYKRAPHMYVGIPTRYVERKSWNMNFEQLGGPENVRKRKEKIKTVSQRHGLAITDAIFMSSRDGITWSRFHEGMLGGEPENANNWVYGDAYLAYNIVETPRPQPEEGTELSLMVLERRIRRMYRYTLRNDGFASYRSDYNITTLETKPLIFSGKELSLNFSTSAMGFVYVEILDEKGKAFEKYRSCELFGNTDDRTVYFGDSADVSQLVGRPVKLRFTMRDADIYSMIFR